ESKAFKLLHASKLQNNVSIKLPNQFYLERKNNLSFNTICSRVVDILQSNELIPSFEDIVAIPLLNKIISEDTNEIARAGIRSCFDYLQIGDVSTQLKVGICYHYGLGLIRDDFRAIEWYIEAAQRGEREAQKILGYT